MAAPMLRDSSEPAIKSLIPLDSDDPWRCYGKSSMTVDSPMTAFQYADKTCPDNYVCTGCKASRVKLWRQYNTFADHIELKCAACAAKDEGKDITGMTPDGMYPMTEHFVGQLTDQIGWMVPAIPTEDGESYWGYSSVPQEGVDWWKALPNVPDHDPIRDEHRLYAVDEFITVAIACLKDYQKVIRESRSPEVKQTWSQWINDFIRFMSW